MARGPLRVFLVLALLAVSLAAAEDTTAAENPDAIFNSQTPQHNVYEDYVHDNGSEWELQLVKGLVKQRTIEKQFMDKLRAGGENSQKMVTKIITAIKALEAARQLKGSQLIKSHFTNEMKILRQSQNSTLQSLAPLLTVQSTDSEALKSLKTQVAITIKKRFSEEIENERNLFKKQIERIKKEHATQTANAKALFQLINDWKTDFRRGLAKASAHLEKISESWEWL